MSRNFIRKVSIIIIILIVATAKGIFQLSFTQSSSITNIFLNVKYQPLKRQIFWKEYKSRLSLSPNIKYLFKIQTENNLFMIVWKQKSPNHYYIPKILNVVFSRRDKFSLHVFFQIPTWFSLECRGVFLQPF